MTDNIILDDNLPQSEQSDFQQISADPQYVKRAYFWAYFGGIGGIIMGHKLAYSSKFINGRVHFIYDAESQSIGKRIQRIGLVIWIPLYLLFIISYIIFVFSIAGRF